jgi:hypothetical protein
MISAQAPPSPPDPPTRPKEIAIGDRVIYEVPHPRCGTILEISPSGTYVKVTDEAMPLGTGGYFQAWVKRGAITEKLK